MLVRCTRRTYVVALLFAVAVPAAAQKTSLPRPTGSSIPIRPNELTPAERAAGWKLLFDGRSLGGWRGVGLDTVPTAPWKVVDGSITRVASDTPSTATADLMTKETFLNFELSWEWQIAPRGNGGLKYNVSEELSLEQATPYAALGFEYQLLDDSLGEDNEAANHRTGALFDLVAPNEGKALHPPGEWNRSAVIVRGGHGEHWLNGEILLAFDLGTPAMDSAIARSKFRAIRGFAEHRPGHIVLQDHGGEVRFRSIKIHPLMNDRKNEGLSTGASERK